MASEGLVSVSVASIVEDMIKQHGSKISNIDLASRKVDEAVGVVEAKHLPDAPSEDEFKFGVRNGMILCNALKKVVPRSVPKVLELGGLECHCGRSGDIDVSVFRECEELTCGHGGKDSRVVNSVLALKSYHDRKNG